MSEERDKYKPREWTDQERFYLTRHVQLPRDESSPNWRTRFIELLKVHRPECPHTVRSLVEVETDHGIWGMEICAECGKQVALECPHVRCSWHNDGQALICDNCGVDGT